MKQILSRKDFSEKMLSHVIFDASSTKELIANGMLTEGIVGWIASGSILSVVDGWLRVTNLAGANKTAIQTVPTVIGKTYEVSAISRVGTASPRVYLNGVYNAGEARQFVATGVNTTISLLSLGAVGTYAEFDNISIIEVD